jgi:hypothetical protein
MLLRLDPPELGRLRISVQMHDQLLTLKVQAETSAGHDALQSRISELRSALQQQGIQLQQLDVELRSPAAPADPSRDAGHDQQSTWHWREPGHEGGPGREDTGQGWAERASDTREPAPGQLTGTTTEDEEHGNVVRPAETGVDLVV